MFLQGRAPVASHPRFRGAFACGWVAIEGCSRAARSPGAGQLGWGCRQAEAAGCFCKTGCLDMDLRQRRYWAGRSRRTRRWRAAFRSGRLPINEARAAETSMLLRLWSMTKASTDIHGGPAQRSPAAMGRAAPPSLRPLPAVGFRLGAALGRPGAALAPACRTQQQATDSPRAPAVGAPAVTACASAGTPGPVPPTLVPTPLPAGQAAALTPENPRPGHRQRRSRPGWMPRRPRPRGYTLIDLSDDWTPFIFAEQHVGHGRRRCPTATAASSSAWPTTSWTRTASRWRRATRTTSSCTASSRRCRCCARASSRTTTATCHDAESARRAGGGRDGLVHPARRDPARRGAHRPHPQGAGGRAAQGQGQDASPSWRPRQPELGRKVEAGGASAPPRSSRWPRSEKRLTCEGLLKPGKQAQDRHLRRAMQAGGAHVPAEAHDLRGELPAPPDHGRAGARRRIDNDQRSLLRALRERVVAAAGDHRRRHACRPHDAAGRTAVRNLADEYTAIAAKRAGAATRRKARWPSSSATPAADFARLRAAVKLPPRPAYYARTWRCRSSSIAATSGTTCPSTKRASAMPQPRKKYPTLHPAGRRTTARSIPLVALAHHHRRLARRAGQRRLRVLPLQGVGRRPARDPPDHLGPGVDRAGVDAHPQPGQAQDRQRAAGQQVVNYDELGPGYTVGLRRGRGLLRHPRRERPRRLRQRHPRARLVGLPVDVQPERLFARLSPPAQSPGDPAVLVHPAPPQDAGGGRSAAGLHRASSCKGEQVYEIASRRAASATSSIRRCRSRCSRARSRASRRSPSWATCPSRA